ncbi:MAG: MBL fold metallo-hydrolase RNA specificity domain-containing protein, partial [Sedimenticola sp.]
MRPGLQSFIFGTFSSRGAAESHRRVFTARPNSAHGDQQDLVNFVKRMRRPPAEVRLVHGDTGAKSTLKQKIEENCPGC